MAGIGSVPVRVAEGAEQPEQDRLCGLGITSEDEEAGDRLEESRQHHPAQDELCGSKLASRSETRKTVAMATKAPITLPTEIAQIPTSERPKQEDRGRADAGPGGDAEQEGVTQSVPHEYLDDGASSGERRADHGRQQDPRQADLPDDGVRDGVLRLTCQMIDDDLPNRLRAERHRADPDAESHGDD